MEAVEVNTFTYDASSGEVAAVVPNIGDWTWCKIGLDENSFKVVKELLVYQTDILTKNLGYKALLDLSMDKGKHKYEPLANNSLLINFIHHEVDERTIRNLYDYAIYTAQNLIPSGNPKKGSNYPYYRFGNMKKIYYIMFDEMKKPRNHSEGIKSWLYKSAIDVCFWHLCVDIGFKAVHKGQELYKVADIEYEWIGLVQMYLDDYKLKVGLDTYTENLIKKDKSDLKTKYLAQIEVARADETQRDKLFDEYFNPNTKMSVTAMRSSMQTFNHALVEFEDRKKHHRRFWNQIVDYLKITPYSRALAVFEDLLPRNCDDKEMLNEFEKLSKRFGELNVDNRKFMNEKYAILKRNYKVKEYVESTLN